jgi:enoyl reductase-like protein
MDWQTIIERLGIPMAILVALAVFIYLKAWPFFIQQVIAFNKERVEERKTQSKEREDFIVALNKITAERNVENDRIREFFNAVENQRQDTQTNNQKIVEQLGRMQEHDKQVAMILLDLVKSVNEIKQQTQAKTSERKTKRKSRNVQ